MTVSKSLAKAQKKYQSKISSRTVQMHKEKDKDLLEKIDNDKEPFATLVKNLLRKHYDIDK